MFLIFKVHSQWRIISVFGIPISNQQTNYFQSNFCGCKAIIHEMHNVYLKTPNTIEEWLLISEKFSQRSNFPNMTGAVDGKHVILQQPCNSKSHHRNYKGTDSIIRMAVVGPEYQFLFADVGMNRRNSDRRNWFEESIRKKYFESSEIKTFT